MTNDVKKVVTQIDALEEVVLAMAQTLSERDPDFTKALIGRLHDRAFRTTRKDLARALQLAARNLTRVQ